MHKCSPLQGKSDRRTYPDPYLGAALREFMLIFGTRLGNVQLLDLAGSHAILSIVAQQGFEKPFLTAFAVVSAEHETACGRALRTGHTSSISDVDTDLEYEPYRAAARTAGYRSVISTPIRTSWGHNIGVISTHFQNPGASGAPVTPPTTPAKPDRETQEGPPRGGLPARLTDAFLLRRTDAFLVRR